VRFIVECSRNGKYCLQYRTICSTAYHGGIRPPSHQGLNGIEDDGFARSGFAGKDDQTFTEVEFKRLDDGKIFDAQLFEHGMSLNPYPRQAVINC